MFMKRQGECTPHTVTIPHLGQYYLETPSCNKKKIMHFGVP